MIDEKKLLEKRTYYPFPLSDYETGWNACNHDWIVRILEQPQVGGVEINKDFETILLCAVRYAIGRKSYMPSMMIDYITPLLPYLSYWILGLMAAEIIDHNYEGGLGDEKIDRPYWEQFLRKIRLEMEGRNEPYRSNEN